jgi:hypothetical protein
VQCSFWRRTRSMVVNGILVAVIHLDEHGSLRNVAVWEPCHSCFAGLQLRRILNLQADPIRMDGTAARIQSFRTASARPACLNTRQASGLASSFSQRCCTKSPGFFGLWALRRRRFTAARAESPSSTDSKDDGKETPLAFSSKEHEYRS